MLVCTLEDFAAHVGLQLYPAAFQDCSKTSIATFAFCVGQHMLSIWFVADHNGLQAMIACMAESTTILVFYHYQLVCTLGQAAKLVALHTGCCFAVVSHLYRLCSGFMHGLSTF